MLIGKVKMEEKVIFEGRLDIKAAEIQTIIDKFILDNFLNQHRVEFRIEKLGNKSVWKTYVYSKSTGAVYKETIHGYIEVNPVLLTQDKPINLRIVSCRPELDLLYFQISQQIQAKSIIPNFPSGVLVTPWKDLVRDGLIVPNKYTPEDIFSDLPDPENIVKKYGTYRDLTANDVRLYVLRCRQAKDKGYTVEEYHKTLGSSPPFSLETFKKYRNNPKFTPKKT
jgi:hypothetical protein